MNIVRRKTDNGVVYANGIGQFVSVGNTAFTIDEATTEWNLPTGGWDTNDYDYVSVELELPLDYPQVEYKLVYVDGVYSFEQI